MDNWISARVHVLDNSSEHDIQALTEDGIVSLAVVLGSSLSLVGLVFAFITYSLFSDLRSAAGTTLMNLLASLFLTQLLFVVGAGGVEAADLCVSLALALHYSRLTVVSWLLVATYDLFRTLRTQSGLIDSPPPSLGGIFWKYTLVGWGLPAICLGGAILIQNGESGGLGESAAASLRSKNCWFPSPRTFTLTFLIPYWMYLSSTIYYTVRNVFAIRLAAAFAPSRKVQLKLTRRRRLQLLLFVRILLYICLVISCGGISLLLETRIPWVMFAVGSSLQGIFVALSVTCNCQVLKLYTRSVRPGGNGLSYGVSGMGMEMAKSGSLQLLTWDPLPDSV